MNWNRTSLLAAGLATTCMAFAQGQPAPHPVAAKPIFQTKTPTSVQPGKTFDCTFVLRNIGEKAWGPGWRLLSVGYGNFGLPAIPITHEVAPGEKTTLTATLTAPKQPGGYWLLFCIQDPSGTKYYNPTQQVDVRVTQDDAQFVSQKSPASVRAGSSFYVQQTFKNTGSTTWTSEGDYNLRSDGTIQPLNWGIHYFPGHPSIQPGETVTISGKCIAPTKPGTYALRWQMGHLGYEFGEKTPEVLLTVTP